MVLLRLFHAIYFYLNYVMWFVMHTYHPPVDMWRTFRVSFDWHKEIHRLYVDAVNGVQRATASARGADDDDEQQDGRSSPIDSSVDYATVIGCTTGVGFESAAALAACGFSVIAGLRGDDGRLDVTAQELRERAAEIRRKHDLDEASSSAKKKNKNNSRHHRHRHQQQEEEHSSFEPVIIPVQVDVSDFKSCIAFCNKVALILGRKTTSSSSSSSASPQRGRRRSVSAHKSRPSNTVASSPASSSLSASLSSSSSSSSSARSGKKLLRVAHFNAAVLMTDFLPTAQGFEQQPATNALGHIVLAEHLLSLGCFFGDEAENGRRLKAGGRMPRDCRLIFTSSSGARFGDPMRGNFLNGVDQLRADKWDQFQNYGDSKALVAAYARLLQRKMLESCDGADASFNICGHKTTTPITIRCLHPGCVASRIVYDSGMPGGKTLAWLQATAGIAIGAMITSEQSVCYILRLAVGVAGSLKYYRRGGAGGGAGGALAREESELFSYIFGFDAHMLRHVIKNERSLEKVQAAVQENLREFLPGKKSVLVS